MIRLVISVLLFMFVSGLPVFGQGLFMHRNIRKAYEQHTRSFDGQPGTAYWQNSAQYKIDVNVDVPTREVSGTAAIRYFNNSPDTLNIIRLKLAHDLWRKNGQRAYDLAPGDITDGVTIKRVSARRTNLTPDKYTQANTFLTLRLDEPLTPSASIEMQIDWSYIAPKDRAPRECVCDSTTWFLAYWYPQVAVYDDLHGWADAPYNGLQEMYNDFSDYEVNITVPGNIMVWATGVWQNAATILQQEYLNRYNTALQSREVVSIFGEADYAGGKPFFQESAKHTFFFKAEQVPDFAFAFSDHYYWDATNALVDPATGRQALVSAAYNPDSKDYYEVCRIAAQGLEVMSTYLPGYPYPYPRMTVFNGQGGMEFPMMCNDGSTYPRSPISLTVHESAHTYFPFMMGINEQYYAWMDEGWAAFFDVLVTDSLAGKPQGRLRGYGNQAGTDIDMPPMTPSRHLDNPAYRVASYNRPQAAYITLYQMLGYERFHQCMVEYMNRWKGKHPQPFDFFHSWNAASGENLDWFWKPWFFDWGYPDLAVTGVDNAGITIENTGTMPVTVVAHVEYTDGTDEYIRRTASVWKSGNKTIQLPVRKGNTVKRVTLGDRLVTDARTENDVWTAE
ncbi:MAG: hypothetical protein EP344_08740 [Bacteroidetes bacterium]|nr:MAG: hypothetical protein EP344_08740 [Bacteroidota bacterium]